MSRALPVALIALFLVGCTKIPDARPGGSDPAALVLLQQSAEAHGWARLQQRTAVHADFDGSWSWLVSRVQPVLVDRDFRGRSSERYAIATPAVDQTHHGKGGEKRVRRDAAGTRVWYNGVESADPEVRDAAALVADNYRMFLLGPGFFLERAAVVHPLGRSTIDGHRCDDVLAVLRPGLGNSTEDRVILSIDRDNRVLRRVRITVEGLASTRGAIADIAFSDHVRFDGVLFPTRYVETLKRPFPADVHDWRLTGIRFE